MSEKDRPRDQRSYAENPQGDHAGKPRARLRLTDLIPNYSNGFAAGTIILTAEGALPVEYLEPGDRVITRAGMRVLKGIDTPTPHHFKLSFERAEVVYADGVQVRTDTGAPLAA